MTLKVIAYAHNGHTDKFGIPRQSRDESPILTRIVFEPEYSIPEALRGIEGYSHLWILWGFDKVQSDKVQSTKEWSPTVRPPRLGGNTRMGVFATRSPFRPNPIGLSSVRLVEVRRTDVQCTKDGQKDGGAKEKRMELIVSGADVLDGTPIYDIKPYLSFSDSHPDAINGFAEETKNRTLKVDWKAVQNLDITSTKPRQDLEREISYILSQDPRPGYQDDPEREYKMDYAGWCVTFRVQDGTVLVEKIEKTQK